MHHRLARRTPSAILSVLLSVASPLTAQPARLIDSLFADMRAPTGPGCVIAFDSAGRRKWLTSFGQRDLERGTRNDSLTVFEAGSVSKQVTAAAVVLLARAGKLSLDDDVRRWIPELPELGRTTVRELLHQQTGWRDWHDLAELSRWPSEQAAYSNADVLHLLERQRSLNFAPGTEYLYSNTNYVLAAILVERVSGESLRSYTQHAIFAPLGMTQTRWRDTRGEIVPNRALGWSPGDSGRFVLDTPIETVVGPSGLLTTIPDLMRWLHNLDSERVGGAGFRDEMERVGVLRSGTATRYAMGLEVSTIDGQRMVSHAGWSGGYVAFAGRLPGRALSLGILCNGAAVNTDDIGPLLLARLGRLTLPVETPRPAAPASVPPAAPSVEKLADYAGRFINADTGAEFDLRVEQGRLVVVRGGVLRNAASPRGEDQFRVPSTSWRLAFQRDAVGRVASLEVSLPRSRQMLFTRLP